MASGIPRASASATTGTRMTAAPGSVISPVGWVYRPPRCRCTSRLAAVIVPHRSSGSAQAVFPAMAGTHQVVESIPMTTSATVAISGNSLRAGHGAAGPGPALAVPAPSTASLRTTVTAAKLAHVGLPGPRWAPVPGDASGGTAERSGGGHANRPIGTDEPVGDPGRVWPACRLH